MASSPTKLEDQNEFLGLALSSPTFADGSPLSRRAVFGKYQTTTGNTTTITSFDAKTPPYPDQSSYLSFASSLRVIFTARVLDEPSVWVLERSLTRLSELLQEEWKAEGSTLRIESFNIRTQDDEMEDPIIEDLPLIAVAFLVMGAVTALFFGAFRRDTKGSRCIQSSALLGLGATITVLLSMLTGYSICLLSGFPITTLTQILPFVLVGIGLDDSFIIFGALQHQTDENKQNSTSNMMIRQALLSVGPSIVVTTVTDCMAFALGAAFSSIPGIRWFCFYAVVCILVDFLYQITFFIAMLELDLRRQDADRYDCFVCLRAKTEPANSTVDAPTSIDHEEGQLPALQLEQQELESADQGGQHVEDVDSFQNKIMRKYSRFLFKPLTKALVVITFTFFFVCMAISASRLEFDFDMTEYMSDDSPIIAFVDADKAYFAEVGGGMTAHIYMQGLDQSSSEIQKQLLDFVADIASMKFVDEFPVSVWFDDLDAFRRNHTELEELSFEEQLDAFLKTEPYHTLHGTDIVRNDTGSVIASRTRVTLNVDQHDTQQQVRLLRQQHHITKQATINQQQNSDRVEHAFLFHQDFPVFFHYQIIPTELLTTLIVQLVAVAIVSMLFFSHPSGTIISVLAMAMVIVELVGVIQLAGFSLNSVTFLLIIMAIGLVVDYCLHIIDAYLKLSRQDFSSRDDRMEAALVDIGGSVFLGGFSTFLGVLALAFASGEVFRTFFVMFVSMVLLGMAHGMVFIPVMMTLIGPTVDGSI
jgi:Niemann-Pick C1 protein